MSGGDHHLRARMAQEQDWICPWCKLPLPDDLADTAIDHIIPICRGGPARRWNMQLLHWRCNGPSEKGSRLTAEAIELAARHGIVLHEPLPTAWPGSSVKLGSGKPNPYRIARENGTTPPPGPPLPSPPPEPREPPPHKVTVRKRYEVECHTCGGIVGAENSWEKALEMKRDHIARNRDSHEAA